MTHRTESGRIAPDTRAHHNEPAFAVYVINLPEATVRRQRIEEHLDSLRVPGVNFVSGVKGTALNSQELADSCDDKAIRSYLGRSLVRGEIGGTLAHHKVYNLFLESENDYALIIEDDALLSDSALRVAECGRLREWMVDDRARIVLMSKASQFLQRMSIPLTGKYRIVKVRNAWFGHGYLINRAAAKKLAIGNWPIRRMMDHWIEIEALFGVDVRAIDPYCIGLHESANQSQIEDVRHNSTQEFSRLDFARFLARKILRRVTNAVFYGPIFGFGNHDGK
jgi:glycosyl transferase family 25